MNAEASPADLVRMFRENAAGLRVLLANVEGKLPSTWNGNTRNAIELRQSRLLDPIHELRKRGHRAAADALLDEHYLLTRKDASQPVDEAALRRCLDEVAVALQDDRRRGFDKADILAIGGKPWANWRSRNQANRIYLPDWLWMPWAGLDISGVDGKPDLRNWATWGKCTVDGQPVGHVIMQELMAAKVFWDNGLIKSTVAEVFTAQGFDGALHQARVLTGIRGAIEKKRG
jgi:hypothetical protein